MERKTIRKEELDKIVYHNTACINHRSREMIKEWWAEWWDRGVQKSPKKTMTIYKFKKIANLFLLCNGTVSAKRAMCFIIEDVLFKTENYGGFVWREWVDGMNVQSTDDDYFDRRYY